MISLLRLLHYILTSPAFPSSSSQVLPSFPCVSWGEPPPSIPSELIPYIPRANGSILWSDVPIEFYGHCTMGLDGKGFQSKKEWNNRLVWKLLQVAETSFGEVEEEWQPIWQEDLESSIYDILSWSPFGVHSAVNQPGVPNQFPLGSGSGRKKAKSVKKSSL